MSKNLVVRDMGLQTSGRGLIISEHMMGEGKLATTEWLVCFGILDKQGKYYKEFELLELYEDFGLCINGKFRVKVQTVDNNY